MTPPCSARTEKHELDNLFMLLTRPIADTGRSNKDQASHRPAGGRGIGDGVRFSRSLMGLQHTANRGVVLPGFARGDFILVVGLLSRCVVVLDIR